MTFVKTRIKNVYEDTKSGVYYVRIRRKGKRPFNKSLDTKNFKTAGQLADELIREYLGHAPKRREHTLFKDEVVLFLESFKNRVKPGTHMRTASVIRLYLMPYFQNKILTEITAAEWDAYILAEKKKRVRNFSNDKKAMRNILTFAVENKRLDVVPELADPTPPSTVGKEYSDPEILSILENCDTDVKRLSVTLAYKSGPRIEEIASIAWAKVNLPGRMIEVKGKTSKKKKDARRNVAIGEQVVALLKMRRNATGSSPWVFPMVTEPSRHMSTNLLENEWQDVKRAAGVTGRFHDLRHTFITRALRAGKSIVWVSKQVGSSVATITKVYDHLKIEELSEMGDIVNVPGEMDFLGVGMVESRK
jgi:integrase